MDPHPELIATRKMSRRGHDKSHYDYRDTPIDTPMWLKLVPEKKRSMRETYEAERIQDFENIIGQGKQLVGLSE